MVAMHSGDGEPTPDVSLEVRLCSSLAAGYTLLVGVSLDYPLLLRLALPKHPSCTNLFGELLYIFL